MLTAALFYGIGGVYAKRAFRGTPVLTMALGQQVGAAGVLLVPTLAVTTSANLSVPVIAALLALGVLSTGVAYLLYFNLIATVGPVKTHTVTYLIPIFGVLWGAAIFGRADFCGDVARFGLHFSERDDGE